MKKMKKLASLVLALAMALTLAVPALAADITMSGGADGAEYSAYKLLNATNDGDLYAYTLNEKYAKILKDVTGKDSQKDIVEYIAGLNASEIRTFANNVYAAIKEAGLEVDYTSSNNKFTDVAQGYYLIAETKLGGNWPNGGTDTFSLVMLDTAGDNNITVSTKEAVPSVEKKVEEKNDSTGDSSWGESADYDVGDDINFVITGTVSAKYADYKSYDYQFEDTMSAGLTYNYDAKVYVVNGDSKVDVTNHFTINDSDRGFTAYANLKTVTGATIGADTEIVVEYSATLNENAVAGTAGNENSVILKYENDPYASSDGEPDGVTPPDVNVVFTYNLTVDKVDGSGNALEGAGFTLYKWNATASDWVAVGNEITGVTTFAFNKLDEGKYKLVESTVPDGYNKADDIEFAIVSTLEGTKLKSLTVDPAADFTVTLESGTIETDVVNNAGALLPETGGMGTTLFYILGGVLVIGAGVALVTKKRMA